MEDVLLDNAVKKAYKWSSITEVLARVIMPLTSMILARLLAPEAFGIFVTVTMVVSFADVFVENGFQKYLIQHQFKSDITEYQYMSVAFWSNLIFSICLWTILIIFRNEIALIAGNKGFGHVIAISGIIIPLNAVVGIQNCKLKKDLRFDKLFVVRIVGALIPLFVTVPLAIMGFDYWALVIGNIAGAIARSILLRFVGGFIPQRFFSRKYFNEMFKSGVWTMLDGLLFWGTSWIDVLLIGNYLNNYYMGLYKNSLSVITSLFAIVISSVTPVLYSTLSKLQDDDVKMKITFLNLQRIISVILIPLSIGLFIYRDFGTLILFGSKWSEASDIVGIMGITIVLRTIFVSFYGDLYRSKGYFYISPLLQLIDIVVMVPVCLLSIKIGFWPFVYARAFVRLDLIIPEMIVAFILFRITPKETISSVVPATVATMLMGGLAFSLRSVSNNDIWNMISILLCVIAYFAILLLFENERKMILSFLKKITLSNTFKK